jgi:hypothetical protein
MDIAKLNTGILAELLKDNETVAFANGKWSLIGLPVGARPRKQEIKWIPTRCIAKRYSIQTNA